MTQTPEIPTYAAACLKCAKACKQPGFVRLVGCPQFTAIKKAKS